MISSRKSILIVDDDPAITRLIAAKLKGLAGTCIECNDSLDAMELVKRQDALVVLLDIDMPKKTGFELLQEIKGYDPSIQVVMITGHQSLFNYMTAFRSGADYLIAKPITDFAPLIDIVRRCFAKLDHWNEMLALVRREKS